MMCRIVQLYKKYDNYKAISTGPKSDGPKSDSTCPGPSEKALMASPE